MAKEDISPHRISKKLNSLLYIPRFTTSTMWNCSNICASWEVVWHLFNSAQDTKLPCQSSHGGGNRLSWIQVEMKRPKYDPYKNMNCCSHVACTRCRGSSQKNEGMCNWSESRTNQIGRLRTNALLLFIYSHAATNSDFQTTRIHHYDSQRTSL
jgi:hypothetical protein